MDQIQSNMIKLIYLMINILKIKEKKLKIINILGKKKLILIILIYEIRGKKARYADL